LSEPPISHFNIFGFWYVLSPILFATFELIIPKVIDEADRLLAQSFQDWLANVLAATRPHYNHQKRARKEDDEYSKAPQPLSNLVPDGLAPSFLDHLPQPHFPSFFLERKASSCQKLLFSATLTRDPGKISALELRNPKYFIVQGSEKETVGGEVLDVVMEKFSMPSTLKVC